MICRRFRRANTICASSRRWTPAPSDYDRSILRHDVPNYTWFLIAFGLLLIPPICHTIRARGFETQRWMKSDHPAGGNSSRMETTK